jgi:hypothetical protein
MRHWKRRARRIKKMNIVKNYLFGRAEGTRNIPVVGRIFGASLFLLACAAHQLFAYDGDAVGGYDGNFSRYNFIQQASNMDTARQVVRNLFGNRGGIDKLFLIGEDDVDEEDVQMLNDLEGYIPTQYGLDNGDAYSYAIKRGDTNNGGDGWVVFSHYLNSSGWFHYVYYFSIVY